MMSLVAGLALWHLAAAAPAPLTSYYYEATTTQSAPGKAEPQVSRMKAWVDGPRARIEFAGGGKKSTYPEGSYVVTKDGGETVYFVNPKKKAYARWELDDVVRDVADRLKNEGGMVRLELTDVSDEKLLEEPSQPILGFEATHRKWRSGYTMKYAILGIDQTRREDTVRELWFSDRISGSGYDALLQPGRLKTGHSGLDKVVAGRIGEPHGFTLRSETVTKVRKGKGEEQTLKSRTDVTLLRAETTDASRFEVPSGYVEKPFKKAR
jgi:hypothetical protein